MRVEISIPPNTSQNNAITTRLNYGEPVMSHQVIKIPKGHAFLTGLRIMAAGVQLLPEPNSNTNWITDDDHTIEKRITVRHDPPSFYMDFIAYNTDDTYSHTFYMEFD